MSKSRTIKYYCEHCNKQFEAEIFESVNVTLDPELRGKVLSGDIFLYKCPHCNKTNIIQYPILYHDMDKKIMIQSGNLSDIYKFKHTFLENKHSLKNFYPEVPLNLDSYKVCGVDSWADLITSIIAFENGLERSILYAIQNMNIYQYKRYAKQNNKPKYLDSNYRYDENGNIALVIEVGDNDRATGCVSVDFNIDEYNDVLDEYGYFFDYSDNFYLDPKKVKRILDLEDDYNLSYLESLKKRFALVELLTGEETFVEIQSFNSCEFKEGDIILAEDHKGSICDAKIILFEKMSVLDFPINPAKLKKALWNKKVIELITTGDPDDELDNDELFEKLISWENTKKNFPNYEICEADIVLGVFATFADNFINKINSRESNLDRLSGNDIKMELSTLENGDERFLKIYLDQSYINKGNGESPIICNFDNIIELVINNSSKYDGVAVVGSDKEIIIRNSYLLNVYKIDKLLTNKKRMINLLEKLTESEIKYIGEFNYKIICKVYFEGMNPSQIKEELHLTPEIISEALDKGYSKLKKVVKMNY